MFHYSPHNATSTQFLGVIHRIEGGYMHGCLIYMYACLSNTIEGPKGMHAPPGNFLKLDALRLLLRPFWNRSRAV